MIIIIINTSRKCCICEVQISKCSTIAEMKKSTQKKRKENERKSERYEHIYLKRYWTHFCKWWLLGIYTHTHTQGFLMRECATEIFSRIIKKEYVHNSNVMHFCVLWVFILLLLILVAPYIHLFCSLSLFSSIFLALWQKFTDFSRFFVGMYLLKSQLVFNFHEHVVRLHFSIRMQSFHRFLIKSLGIF